MGPRFDETPAGRKFYAGDFPKLIKAIEENTAELKRVNDLKAKELELLFSTELERSDKDGESDF